MSCMEIHASNAMEKSTMGTTINFSRFRKIAPGLDVEPLQIFSRHTADVHGNQQQSRCNAHQQSTKIQKAGSFFVS